MNFFRLAIVLRILLAIGFGLAGIYLLLESPYWMVSLWMFVFFVWSLVDLIRIVERSDRDLTNLLLSIRQGDFTNTYPEKKKKSPTLYHSFNVITGEFRKLRREKEFNYHFLQAVIENCGVPLLSYEVNSEEISSLNQEAKTLFSIPYFSKLETLSRVSPEMVTSIRSLSSGEKVLLRVVLQQQPAYLSVIAKEVVLQQKRHKLIAFHHINSELDQKEIESWQKLIRVLSHEIKNSVIPIATLAEVISGMLTDLETQGRSINSLSKEESEDLVLSVKTIEKRSKGLVKFVSSYGDLAKVPKPELQAVCLQTVIRESVKLQEDFMKKSGISYDLKLPKKELFHSIDKDLIGQVLINLIKNAIEAMQETSEKTLEIFLTKQASEVKVSVKDSGPGMDAETLETIFVPFYTTKREGSGIGLSLSRQIMKAHGGILKANAQLGKGATFEMIFLK